MINVCFKLIHIFIKTDKFHSAVSVWNDDQSKMSIRPGCLIAYIVINVS